MKNLIAFLLAIPIGCYLGNYAYVHAGVAPLGLPDGERSATVAAQAPDYDVQGLNNMVGRIEKPASFAQRQASALASIYGLGGEDDMKPLEILK